MRVRTIDRLGERRACRRVIWTIPSNSRALTRHPLTRPAVGSEPLGMSTLRDWLSSVPKTSTKRAGAASCHGGSG